MAKTGIAICACVALLALVSSPARAGARSESTATEEEITSIPVPGKAGVTYALRWAQDCRAARGACDPDRNTRRRRVEDSTGPGRVVYYDPDPARNPMVPMGWVLTPGRYLTLRKSSEGHPVRVVIVSLPDGKVLDEDTYTEWFHMDVWSNPGVVAYLRGQQQAGQPTRLYSIEADGRITPIENSDWRRYSTGNGRYPGCSSATMDAAFPLESLAARLPGQPYAEVIRRAAKDGTAFAPDMSSEGYSDGLCPRFSSQFWVVRRRDGTGWQAIGSGGVPLAGNAVFDTRAKAEAAGAVDASGRQQAQQAAEVRRAQQAEAEARQRDAAEQAAAEAVRQRELTDRAARDRAINEKRAVLRAQVEALWQQGAYARAAAASRGLGADTFAGYLLASPSSGVADYRDGLAAMAAEGTYLPAYPLAIRLQRRIDAMLACEQRRQAPAHARSRWESMAPYDQARMLMAGPPRHYQRPLSPGELWAFDASAFEWTVIYESNPARRTGHRLINVPQSVQDTTEAAAGRESAYQQCLAAARSAS